MVTLMQYSYFLQKLIKKQRALNSPVSSARTRGSARRRLMGWSRRISVVFQQFGRCGSNLQALPRELQFEKIRADNGGSMQNPGLPISDQGGRRIASIDIVRGLAMVFMALDHTRDFISNIPFEPEDIDHTWGFYFLVRWVTHFCAPAFFLLAGTGAYLYGRKHSAGALQMFLVSRGVWLVALEFTVIGFAWTFHPGWGMFGVICCLGLSMIMLAGFIRLPRFVGMAVAPLVIATHDLFDAPSPLIFIPISGCCSCCIARAGLISATCACSFCFR
jgi:hypothetical protein